MSEPSQASHVKMEAVLQQRPNDSCLVVGFDFGTTFSAIAWAMFNSNTQRISKDQIRTIRAWPSSHGPDRDESKVPSRLIYNAQKELIGWGFETADGNAIVLEWFKLAIVPEKDLPLHMRNSEKLKATRKQIKELGLEPTEVISQYIHMIWAHAKAEIKKSIGERAFKAMPIKVVFTVPAIWGKREIKAMEDAASSSIIQRRAAGQTTVQHLSEPEAAVQAYAAELKDKLHEDESVVVSDLGGGTGDFISCLMKGVNDGTHVELDEATHGAGEICGAILADEAFEKLFMSRLPARHKDLKTKDPAAWDRIMKEWQHSIKRSFEWQHSIKRSFEWHGKGKIWDVYLSNLNGDAVHLHEDEIRDVFESSVVPTIIRLVKKQIEQVKKAHGGKAPVIILPVGGFGRCPYVLQRLREEFEGVAVARKGGARKRQKLNFQKIEVHSETGQMPWTAVCRGACLFGLRAQMNMRVVKSRLSRTNIGFIENAPGLPKDGGIWMPDFGKYRIPDKLTYIVRKGDSIDTGQKAQMAMHFVLDDKAKGMHVENAVFYSHDGNSPPGRFDPNNAGLQKYGVMEIKVPVPIERWPKKHIDVGLSRVFDYHVVTETIGGSVQVTVTDTHGVVMGELVLPNLVVDEYETI